MFRRVRLCRKVLGFLCLRYRNQETKMIPLLNTVIYGFVVRTYTGYGLKSHRCF